MAREIRLREAREDDLPVLLDIYNDAVLTSSATFDLEEQTLDERRGWFGAHGGRYPLIAAEIEGKVVGYCSVSIQGKAGLFKERRTISLCSKRLQEDGNSHRVDA